MSPTCGERAFLLRGAPRLSARYRSRSTRTGQDVGVPTSREQDARGGRKGKERGTVRAVGQRARMLKMSIANEQEFNRYSISLTDFEKASECVAEARKRLPNDLVFEALLFLAIIVYCRPFSLNERSKDNLKAKSRLNLEDLIVPSDREKELHTECETLRNKALAHSEFAYNPTSLNPRSGVISSKPFSLLTQQFDLDGLADLLRKLAEACHSKRATYVRG